MDDSKTVRQQRLAVALSSLESLLRTEADQEAEECLEHACHLIHIAAKFTQEKPTNE